MMERLCYIKLINGEDIVGTVEDITTDSHEVMIFQPLRVHFVRVPGHTGIQLGQWIPFAEDDVFPIKKRHILWIEECKEDFIAHYNEAIDFYNNDDDDMSLMDRIEAARSESEERLKERVMEHLQLTANNHTIH
tara:strand:- start:2598 stop:2999 length:402 start_codon:yes stop_codon:yes gene_type:complete